MHKPKSLDVTLHGCINQRDIKPKDTSPSPNVHFLAAFLRSHSSHGVAFDLI